MTNDAIRVFVIANHDILQPFRGPGLRQKIQKILALLSWDTVVFVLGAPIVTFLLG
jgi:hypothetical protein